MSTDRNQNYLTFAYLHLANDDWLTMQDSSQTPQAEKHGPSPPLLSCYLRGIVVTRRVAYGENKCHSPCKLGRIAALYKCSNVSVQNHCLFSLYSCTECPLCSARKPKRIPSGGAQLCALRFTGCKSNSYFVRPSVPGIKKIEQTDKISWQCCTTRGHTSNNSFLRNTDG